MTMSNERKAENEPLPDNDPVVSAPLLCAYLDDQLDLGERLRVEAWLEEYPQAKADLEEMRQLVPLWQANPPPEPTLETWYTVREQIENGLHTPCKGSRSTRASRGQLAGVIGGLSVAAALLLFLLGRPWWTTERPPDKPRGNPGIAQLPPEQGTEEEPFEVAQAHEVNIISMDAADADLLALEGSPMLGEIELARPEDIYIVRVEPGQENQPMARVEEGAYPMIVPALASAKDQ
jgi:hypothetical protein